MKVQDFIDKLKMTASKQTTYLSGGFGCRLGKDWYNADYSWNKQHADEIDKKKNTDPITFGFDCVCLLKGILWGFNADPSKEYGGSVYKSNGVDDLGTKAFANTCPDLTDTNWEDIEPGEIVYMSGHIGAYVGDGLCIEATPAWKSGVQYSALGNIGKVEGYPTRSWTKHGHSSFIDYTQSCEVAYALLSAKYGDLEQERDRIRVENENLRKDVISLNTAYTELKEEHKTLKEKFDQQVERNATIRRDLERSADKYLTMKAERDQAIKELNELKGQEKESLITKIKNKLKG